MEREAEEIINEMYRVIESELEGVESLLNCTARNLYVANLENKTDEIRLLQEVADKVKEAYRLVDRLRHC
jgi:flagellin-specific chaperone FliS